MSLYLCLVLELNVVLGTNVQWSWYCSSLLVEYLGIGRGSFFLILGEPAYIYLRLSVSAKSALYQPHPK